MVKENPLVAIEGGNQEGGGVGGLLLDTTGSRKYEVDAVFLPQEANQILETVWSVAKWQTSAEASTVQGQNNNR